MIEANTAARLAARFATLAPAQRRAFLDKMAGQGIAFSQLPIPALPRPDAAAGYDAPLSYAQQRQWFLHRFAPDSAAYHISSRVDLRGELDIGALQAAFAMLARRHEALRTVFLADPDGKVRQHVRAEASIELPLTDLSADPTSADARAAAIAEAPFDLGSAPLLRVHLLRLGAAHHRLVLAMHHIVSDGWSMQLLIDELAAAYRAQRTGQPLPLAKQDIGYTDYAVWQRNWLEAGEQARQLAWWRQALDGAPGVLALPADRPRPAAAAYHAQRCEIAIADTLAQALRQRAQACGGTLFMALLAGFQALLYRYTGSRDLCVGVPVAGRNRIETERVVGLFVNTQVVRGTIDGSQPLSALLGRTREAVLGAQAHQDLPFEQLVEALQPERSLSYHPLFQVVHNHRRGDRAARASLPGLELESAPVGERTTALELTLDTREDSDGHIHACFLYAAELFDAGTVQRLARHYVRLLGRLADAPEQALDAVELLDDSERSGLMALGRGAPSVGENLPVHAHIARHAAANPEAVAVICGDQTLRYGELLARADGLAAVLHARGIGAEHRVGIALSRSPDLIVALLAVMRSGAAYVPFDPAYPKDRLAYLFDDSAIRLLVTEPALLDTLPAPASLPVLTLDTVDEQIEPLTEQPIHPGQLAYLIYTSGSTGRPKGVCVAHGPLAMHVAATIDAYEMGPHSRELHFLSFAFDGAHERWLCALACGGSLLLRDDALWTPEQTAAAMTRHGVTNAGFPPAYLRQLAEYCEQSGERPPVALYSFGGEAMPRAAFAQARRALAPRSFINGYGPTETVVTPMVWKVRADAPEAEFSGTYAPIGRPVGTRRCYLLDAELNLVPPGVAGELYIGGEGLARGYLNRGGMTAERFVPDPFAGDGARLYRTGDLARWLPDGELEYLGRIDQQLKIRGFRIEPGEIEARILAQPGVANAAVIAAEGPSGARLVAYVVPAAGATLESATLRTTLAAELPDYMVPAAFVVLDTLPLTPNGKLDRRALPAPTFDSAQDFAAPEGDAETALAAIWSEVLNLPRVGRADNFFELGGDSILSLQIVARARAAGWVLTPRQLFERQTLAELAAVAAPVVQDVIDSNAVPVGAVPLLPIQADFFETPMRQRHHWNQSVLLNCRAAPDAPALAAALADVVAHHDALRLRFVQRDGVWQQAYAGIEASPDLLWVRHAESEAERLAHCEAAQRSLDLAEGPLLRAVALQCGERWQLLLVIHHLVVDGVSWRVLVEDLRDAYQQRMQGQPAVLPARTASYQRWSQALRTNAATRDDELPHWQALAQVDASLPCDDPTGTLTIAERDAVTLTLPAELTQALLQRAPAAYRTRVNDLLLTALARALGAWSGRAQVLIDLESHGRVAGVDDTLDLSRTVGWFTTMFPVALNGTGALDTAIKAVKEQLRAVPGDGIGFGLLRRFGSSAQQVALAAVPKPDVVFNYLGQLDASFSDDGPWRLSGDSAGANQDPATPLSHPLSVSGQVQDGQLKLSVAYARRRYRAATIEALASALRAELEAVVAHCTAGAAGLTPSDFPLARLSQARLDALGLVPQQVQDLYPLSPMQAGMLFHSVFAEHGSAYTNQLRVDVDGIEPDRFTAAWHAVLARHDSLRSGFLHRADPPLQWVARQAALPMLVEDWRGRSTDEIDAFADSQREQGFDLTQPPLMRLALLRTGANRHHLVWTVHHLLLDGWSTAQLLGEVLRHYAGETLPASDGRFADYIGWLQSRDAAAGEAFWKAQLAPLDAPTRLLAALPAPDHGQGQGEHHHELDAAETAVLTSFARTQKVTLNTLVQAAWLLLLQRCTGQPCVAFGATVAGRPAELPAAQQMLGLFINTLPVIASPRPQQAVGDWLREVQALNLALREHEHTALYDIQRWAGHSGQALFDSIVVFENYPVDAALRRTPAGLAFSGVRNRAETNYPLTLLFAHTDTLHLTCRFDRAQLAAPHAAQLARSLFAVLRQLAADATRPLGEIALMAPPEARAALALGADPQPYPAAEPVHRLFEARVAEQPDAMALCFGEERLTYAALNRRANALAHRLVAQGVGPDVPVGVLAERSVEMVVALLAILKAGGAYVPFDPDYPADRLAYMIEDSGVALVLVQRHDAMPALSRAVGIVDLSDPALYTQGGDRNPAPALSPENLAYVIYTSGSTGRPKGAGNRHGALYNRLWWMQAQYRLDAGDTVLQKTPFSFDVSVWEFFWPLMTGARLALAAPGDHRDPQRIAALIAQHGVTTLHFVPAMLQAFVADGTVAPRCASVRHIVCSGEALPAELARRTMALLPHAGLHNLYGPTEAAIDVTHWTCRDDGGHAVPIGRPIANVSAHVLDGALQPVPDGVAGELYLGGAGLARGYLGRAALTAERFVADPHSAQGERLYRTGDLARRRADGQIEYLGRLDHQVKIRGLRIELGEIEARLLAHGSVREAVAVALTGDGPARLVAYAVPAAGAAVDTDALRAWLAQALPDYMVPGAIVVLERMPVTPNGKLDRRALPSPEFTGTSAYEPPQPGVEAVLAETWAAVLKVARVGRHDNFFELGGDSILSLQIVARLRALGWLLTPRQLFERQTLAAVAQALSPLDANAGEVRAEATPRRATLRSEDFPLARLSQGQLDGLGLYAAQVQDLYPLSPMQAGMLYHSVARADAGGAYINQLRVDVDGLDAARFAQAWREALGCHDALRTGFLQRGEQPLQWVAHAVPLPLAEHDWSAQPPEALPAALDQLAAADLARGFELECPPLMRLTLVRTGADRHHLVWTVHHLLLDGWSTSQLLGQVLKRYAGEAVAPAEGRFADYIRWLQQRDAGAAQAFWAGQLDGFDTPTRLAQALPAPAAGEGYGLLQHACSAALTERLSAYARAQKVTLNTVVQAAWLLLLQRYTGQRRVAFGATVAGRPADVPGSQQMLGLFINTLPVLSAPRPEQAVGDWLRELQAFNLAAREHGHTPLSDLQRWGGQAGQRLFDSILVFENFPLEDALASASRSGLRLQTQGSTGLTEYEMDVEVSLRQTLRLGFTYMRRAFDAAQVARICAQMTGLLEAIGTVPGQTVGALSLLTQQERTALRALGRGEPPVGENLPVHAHIARHAAANPEAVAVICGDQTLRYGELLARADRLAAVLHARGIGAEHRVGIALSRSPDLIVALLAVMRSGAAYVPFDPAYPKDRLAYLFDDSAIRLLVTEPALLDTLPAPASLPVLTLDTVDEQIAPLTEQPIHPGQLAYVIYTSGSTGRPKGVCVAHGPLAMHVAATIDAYEMGPHSRELHFLSFAFDGAHERWLCALACGGSLLLRDDALWTPEQTAAAMTRHGVTNAGFPPAYLRQLAEYCEQSGERPPVALYSFGGEAMPRAAFAQARRALAPRSFINGYGPTETVVTPMVWKVRADAPEAEFSGTYAPIGRPVGGRRCYLLDAELNLVPPGVAGELYIGGEGLARGYLNRGGMTAERFVPDPFAGDGARLYRTGDLARWLPDGQLEYLGRIDQQLKIRGFRIEPGEIEARILAQAGVGNAAVIAAEGPSGARLVAYVVPAAGATLDGATLRTALAAELPDYMVPAAFVVLDTLPLTPNGKLDRRALPVPGAETSDEYVAPRTEAQRWLAQVWQDVLGVPRVGLDDNFFALGGDSLLSLKVISRVRANRALGLDLKLRDLMRTPTIGQLLPDGEPAVAGPGAKPAALRVLAAGPANATLPPIACIHAALGTLFDYDAIVAQLGAQRTVYGFQARALADPAWRDASLASIAADYVREWRAVQPQGPYLLLGWSLGATLATLMARELEAQGQTVQWLGLVDPFVPEPRPHAGAATPGWPAALAAFAARLLPDAAPPALPADAAPEPDAAAVRALLAPCIAASAAPQAALGADELAHMFLAAHRLGLLAAAQRALPVVQAPRALWWRAGRDGAAARLAGWLGAPREETVLEGVDHHAIVRDPRLLAQLRRSVGARPEPDTEARHPATGTATLPT
ncbi:amino acid adenylation domain-containing protein [Cupriavidus taiwanensis]|uniref:non-ribosomal peptide synthetase n=1 Tax=Cupriavidus taiwanensis TaxID=164546 RepID=UPI00254028CE|nr:non-ribosomal peptide synthetase [Cupriavidus taiwanensis]MDK3025010.1 amino acid adenylation domain-containing protein [Cupriavidus taiwanensis]